MRVRSLAALLGALLLAFLSFTATASAQYPDEGTSAAAGSVDDSSVRPGESVTFSGGGFEPAVVLNVALNGAAAGTTTTNNAGNFSTSVRPTACGQNVLSASGEGANGGNRVVTARVNVTCTAAAGASTGSLPRTGSDVSTTALVAGLTLVTVGALFVYGARSRARRVV